MGGAFGDKNTLRTRVGRFAAAADQLIGLLFGYWFVMTALPVPAATQKEYSCSGAKPPG